MAYTTINKNTDYFNTVLYTGDGSSSRSITGVGFQPDWLWVKERSSTSSHQVADAVRGAYNRIQTDNNNAQQIDSSPYNDFKSFDSDGWSMGNGGAINENSQTYVAWNWKANGAGSANTDGATNTTVSVNTTAGFSIVKWTGTGSATTLGHGLGAVPKFWIIKNLDQVEDWRIYHNSLGNTKMLELNNTNAEASDISYWNNTSPTSSVMTVGSSNANNGSGRNMIAYCFAEKTGYSKFGSYIGNASSNGTFVYLGFKPSFLMVKRTDSTSDWLICDNKRNNHSITYPTNNINPINGKIFANLNQAEEFYNSYDFLSNGFKIKTSGTGHNASGANMIYMAFGQSLVGSNNIPCTAR